MNREEFIEQVKIIAAKAKDADVFFEGEKIDVAGIGEGKENDWNFSCYLHHDGAISNYFSNYNILTTKFSAVQYNMMCLIEQYNEERDPDEYVFSAIEYVKRDIVVHARSKEEALKLAEEKVKNIKFEPSRNWIVTKSGGV